MRFGQIIDYYLKCGYKSGKRESGENGNTATLIRKAPEGTKPVGAETALIHLYDLSFKSCKAGFCGCAFHHRLSFNTK